MDAEQIKAIQDFVKRSYPDDGSVTGYRFEPHYCGEYEGKLVFFLENMPPKLCPDSPMYVGSPLFAFVAPNHPEQFNVVSDGHLKFFNMFYDKISDKD